MLRIGFFAGFFLLIGYKPLLCQDLNYEWHNALHGSGYVAFLDMAVDDNGNTYVIGLYDDDIYDDIDDPVPIIDPSTSSTTTNVVIAKFSSAGETVWVKSLEGPFTDEGRAIKIHPSGDIIIAGVYESYVDCDAGPGESLLFQIEGNLGQDWFVMRMTPDGELVWATGMGGFYDDFVGGIDIDNEGNIYLAGSFTYVAQFDPGPGSDIQGEFFTDSNGFLQKFDEDGNVLWSRTFISVEEDRCNAVAVDSQGRVFVAGRHTEPMDLDPGPEEYWTDSTFHDNGYFLSEFDSDGNFISYTDVFGRNVMDMEFNDQDELIIGGELRGNIIDFDTTEEGVHLIDFNGWIQTGGFLQKYSPDLEFEWVTTFWSHDNTSNAIRAVSWDENGASYGIGRTKGIAEFNLGDVEFTHESSIGITGILQANPLFIKQSSPDSLDFLYTYPTNLPINGTCIAAGNGIVSIAAAVGNLDTLDLDFGDGIESLIYDGIYSDPFVATYSMMPVGISERGSYLNYNLYPNPTTGAISIHSKSQFSQSRFRLLNTLGECVLEGQLRSRSNQLNIDGPAGLYFLEIQTDMGSVVKKVIKNN